MAQSPCPEGGYSDTATAFVDGRVLLDSCAGDDLVGLLNRTRITAFDLDWLFKSHDRRGLPSSARALDSATWRGIVVGITTSVDDGRCAEPGSGGPSVGWEGIGR